MPDISKVTPAIGRGMIDLRKMEQFVAVAEERHFHRAANRLGMSQPPLTVAIRKLEEDLGIELLDRGQNRVLGLTAAGLTFLREARETLRQADHAITTARDTAAGRTGLIRLGYVGSALYGRLPDTIREFRNARPHVRLELREATTASQIAGLRGGSLDAGVIIPPIAQTAGIELRDFDKDKLSIALPSDHHLADKDDLCLPDIADEDFVLWPMVEGRGFHLQVIRLCAEAGFVPRVTQEAHGIHAVLSLVAVGAGVAIVPESMQQFRPGQVTYRSIAAAGADFPLCLAVLEPSPATAAFVKMAS